jgi:tetratricopeptide (TPR) repeat protein
MTAVIMVLVSCVPRVMPVATPTKAAVTPIVTSTIRPVPTTTETQVVATSTPVPSLTPSTTPSPTATPSPTPIPTPVVFAGAFSLNKALLAIYPQEGVVAHDGRIEVPDAQVGTRTFEVLLSALFTERTLQQHVIFLGDITEAGGCHACFAPILGFVFSRVASEWRLEFRNDSLGAMGPYGFPPHGKLLQLGEDRYGFLFYDSFGGQGYSEKSLILFAVVNGNIDTILTARAGEENYLDNQQREWGYDSVVSFKPDHATEMNDLVLQANGTMRGGAVNFKSIFVFDGAMYVLSDTTNPTMYLDAGHRHYYEGAYAYAIADYTHFLSLGVEPTDPNADDMGGIYTTRGHAYLKLGDYDLALNDYEKALSYSEAPDIYLGRGLAYLAKGELDAAVDEFTKVINSGDLSGVSSCERGLIYMSMGQRDSARTDLQKCERLAEYYRVYPGDLLSGDEWTDLHSRVEQALRELGNP